MKRLVFAAAVAAMAPAGALWAVGVDITVARPQSTVLTANFPV